MPSKRRTPRATARAPKKTPNSPRYVVVPSPYQGVLDAPPKKAYRAFVQSVSSSTFGEADDQGLDRLMRLYGRSSSWAYIAVKRISDAFAQIPWQIIRSAKKGKPGAVVEGPAGGLRTLLSQPNPYESLFEFLASIAVSDRLTGNVFVEKANLDGYGRPHSLYALNPSRMRIVAGDQDTKVRAYKYDLGARTVTFAPEEIIHIRDPHPMNDYWGLSPMTAALAPIAMDKSAVDWNRQFMQKGAWPAGAITTEGDPDEKTMRRLRAEIKKMVSGGKDKVGQVILLTGGLKYDKIALSPKEVDWLDARRFARDEILAIYGVPFAVASLSSAESTTQHSAGFGQQVINFYLFTVFPLVQKILGGLNRGLSSLYPGGLEIVPNYRAVPALKDDVQKDLVRSQAFRTLVSSGWSIEMALAELYDHVKSPAWGQVAWMNQAMVPIKGPDNPFAQAAPTGAPADNVPTDPNNPAEGDPATADPGGAAGKGKALEEFLGLGADSEFDALFARISARVPESDA